MGQKINPIGLRLGINRTWDSRWYANKGEYGNLLQEDLKIRATLLEDLKQAAVSKIVIERPHRKCRVSIHTARPGIVIGKKGADIDKIRAKVKRFTDIDYGTAEAKTTYGIIGIKVWVFKGEVLEHDPSAHERRATEGGGSNEGGQRRERDDRGDRGGRDRDRAPAN